MNRLNSKWLPACFCVIAALPACKSNDGAGASPTASGSALIPSPTVTAMASAAPAVPVDAAGITKEALEARLDKGGYRVTRAKQYDDEHHRIVMSVQKKGDAEPKSGGTVYVVSPDSVADAKNPKPIIEVGTRAMTRVGWVPKKGKTYDIEAVAKEVGALAPPDQLTSAISKLDGMADKRKLEREPMKSGFALLASGVASNFRTYSNADGELTIHVLSFDKLVEAKLARVVGNAVLFVEGDDGESARAIFELVSTR